MGGVNQNRHAGAYSAKAASHHSASSVNGVGFAALPEYQYPEKHHKSATPYPANQQQRVSPQSLRPRQHIVPTAAQQHQYPVQHPQAMDSPTLSQGESESGSNTSGSQPCFHYNPYDLQCSRVTYQQQLLQQQHQQPQFPTPGSESRNSSLGYDQPRNHANNAEDYYPGEYDEQQMEEAPAKSALPYGTLHGHLEGYVSFVAYPTEEFVNPNKSQSHVPCEGNMSRVFLGQLPYQVTDMQLDWLCFTFGNGGSVHFPERITKHDPMRGCKVPTGCIHAYAENDVVTAMLSAMHKRVLVDDTGVWYAETPEQQSVLNDYCLMMKNDRTKRYQNRPYDTVVAQFATSSFVRRR